MTQSNFVEIVFNFDTTGSMYPVLREVRNKLQETIGVLFKELPNLRVGIGANGDYCDAGRPYVTAHTDLTTNIEHLKKFVTEVQSTGGGANGGEAYELALRETKTKYSWSKDSQKILVMIGDEVAHTPHFIDNRQSINWRKEAAELRDQGISVYTIQCLDRRDQNAAGYYSDLAEIGGGMWLRMDQFSDIVELVMAITYRQVGVERVEQYEQSVAATKMINRTLDRSFSVLTGRAINLSDEINTGSRRYNAASTSGDLVPVAPGRFQVLHVDQNTVIKDFVEDNQLPFKTGRGFYEFTKREEVQPKKEVVVRDLTTGDMFCGDAARNIIGLPKGDRGMVKPSTSGKYKVFIQSTSYNRKLIGNTEFLYEVDVTT
jgi:hypothetical protein